jgi:hypothetical protein
LRLGDHLPDGAKRCFDCLQIIAFHDLTEFALLRAVGGSIDKLQGETEPQLRIVVVAENLVDDEAVDIAGLAYENDLALRTSPFASRLTMSHFAMPGTKGKAFSAFITRPFQISPRVSFGSPGLRFWFAGTSLET